MIWGHAFEHKFWYDGKEYRVCWNEQDSEWDLWEVLQGMGGGWEWRDSDGNDSPLLLVARLVAGDQRFMSAATTAETLLLCGQTPIVTE